MHVRGSPPTGGAKDRNWKSVGLGLNKKLRGWIAGPAIRLTVHQGKPSKICLRVYKGKKTACEKCEQARPLTGLIFVPFYPEENQLRCVLHVHDDCNRALAGLDLHDHFTAFRGGESDVGVQLVRNDPQTSYSTIIPTRRASADISDWLVGFMGVRGELSADELLAGARFIEGSNELAPVCEESPSVTDVPGAEAVRQQALGLAEQFRLRGAIQDGVKVWTETTTDGKTELKSTRPSKNGKH